MPSIADSSAVLYSDRVLPQHQAALTLIKDRVENPALGSFSWLDIACGQGQILSNVSEILSPECCQKIKYVGVDVVQEYTLKAERAAQSLFADTRIAVCDIDRFEQYLLPNEKFDAVTLTNTVHEISPEQLAVTFVSALNRVTQGGFMFTYDMETLPNFELGAIPWLGKDIEQVFHRLLLEAGETAYNPSVAVWPHKTCKGWHLQINRSHIRVPARRLAGRREQMITGTSSIIRSLLEKRLLDTNTALSALSRYGADSAEERADVQRLLNDYWAISRSLRHPLILSSGISCEA